MGWPVVVAVVTLEGTNVDSWDSRSESRCSRFVLPCALLKLSSLPHGSFPIVSHQLFSYEDFQNLIQCRRGSTSKTIL